MKFNALDFNHHTAIELQINPLTLNLSSEFSSNERSKCSTACIFNMVDNERLMTVVWLDYTLILHVHVFVFHMCQ